VDFLLVLTELFVARCYGWGATSGLSVQNQRLRSNGDRLTQNFR